MSTPARSLARLARPTGLRRLWEAGLLRPAPRRFIQVEEFPRTATAKVRKQELRRAFST